MSSPIAAPSGTRVGRRRVKLPGSAYLVTWMTRDRQPHFQDLRVARNVVAAMRQLDGAGNTRSMAWVLMPDHMHWLVQPEGRVGVDAIAEVLRQATDGLVQTVGGLWAADFSAEPVPEDTDIRQMSREIVANPLRWGLVESLGDYPHWDAIWI